MNWTEHKYIQPECKTVLFLFCFCRKCNQINKSQTAGRNMLFVYEKLKCERNEQNGLKNYAIFHTALHNHSKLKLQWPFEREKKSFLSIIKMDMAHV